MSPHWKKPFSLPLIQNLKEPFILDLTWRWSTQTMTNRDWLWQCKLGDIAKHILHWNDIKRTAALASWALQSQIHLHNTQYIYSISFCIKCSHTIETWSIKGKKKASSCKLWTKSWGTSGGKAWRTLFYFSRHIFLFTNIFDNYIFTHQFWFHKWFFRFYKVIFTTQFIVMTCNSTCSTTHSQKAQQPMWAPAGHKLWQQWLCHR